MNLKPNSGEMVNFKCSTIVSQVQYILSIAFNLIYYTELFIHAGKDIASGKF
jgi:hypothetical protein